MPQLDRPVTLRLRNEGYRDTLDEYVPGAWRETRIWAAVQEGGSYDQLGESGTRVTSVRNFTVRYRSDLAATPPERVEIVDEEGVPWTVEGVDPSDVRRRFLTITAVSGG